MLQTKWIQGDAEAAMTLLFLTKNHLCAHRNNLFTEQNQIAVQGQIRMQENIHRHLLLFLLQNKIVQRY